MLFIPLPPALPCPVVADPPVSVILPPPPPLPPDAPLAELPAPPAPPPSAVIVPLVAAELVTVPVPKTEGEPDEP